MSDTHATVVNLSKGRNAVTNGRMHPRAIDGRLRSAKRFRDLFDSFADSLGGKAGLSEADRALARMAASLTLKSESMQAEVAKGGEIDAEQLVRVSNSLARVLGRLRKRQVAPPSLHDRIAAAYPAARLPGKAAS